MKVGPPMANGDADGHQHHSTQPGAALAPLPLEPDGGAQDEGDRQGDECVEERHGQARVRIGRKAF